MKHIVITGASSGIGKALAENYAKDGTLLSLTGRNADRLETVADSCRSQGAQVKAELINVENRAAMHEWLKNRDNEAPIDLVIANAGIGAGRGDETIESPEQVLQVFNTNWNGVLNTIDPLLPRMIKRGHGQIALMSSLAGFRGWPGAPAYCASKAAVKIYGEGLRGAVKNTGVKINVICPGFVKSRMTDQNQFPMPFLMPVEKASRIIQTGLEKNKGRISFPWQTNFIAWLFGAMPESLAAKCLQSAPRKSTIKL